MHQINRLSSALLRSPLLWGSLLAVGFFAPIETGAITNPDVLRYFAGHWINYIETVAFFVALAALALKALDVAGQMANVEDQLFLSAARQRQSLDECEALLDEVTTYERRNGGGYLSRRLRAALLFISRKGSADTLEQEIKYLSETDQVEAAQSYGFIKIIIWAIPILGFLGTVIGITIAIANLNPHELEQSLPDVTHGLGVAFDTTALALGLSMVLMFIQFAVDKYEGQLLSSVDRRAGEELIGRFRAEVGSQDPLMLAVRRMTEAILPNIEQLVVRQSELWKSTIDQASAHWLRTSQNTTEQLETALGSALSRSMKEHAQELGTAEKEICHRNAEYWSQLTQALQQNASAIEQQQTELTRQAEVLLKVVDATEQVTRLENTLNRNLQSLAGARNFEETVVSLAAAIQLLSARLGQMPADGRTIELPRHKTMVQAA